jgi:hypothetical protein
LFSLLSLNLPPGIVFLISIFCGIQFTSSDYKKVTFVFFVVESLSNPGKSMSITKLSGKIGFEIFPDFEIP